MTRQNAMAESVEITRAERRKRKPKAIAFVGEACSGCGGSPVCQLTCPVEGCMALVPNPVAPVFRVVEIDPLKCIGCRRCCARGPAGARLDGCPWDAITVIRTSDFEARHGELPY